ncbi:transient receptor potential cation channel subfamily A member 1-like isoform X2 [Lycorma delicatula]|uniref:transient receptor potential cation channel subfamily A member 1-like isoform X2 n=1 Tax=Lycorma delicatula TaxID=130591 RepID=UPI003F51A4FE
MEIKTDKSLDNRICQNVATLMSAIYLSTDDKVRKILELYKIPKIVNYACGPVMVSPLQLACSLSCSKTVTEIVRLLLQNGAKLPLPECWGRTPLHQAAKGGHVRCVELLLEKKANVNCLDEKNISPLLLASKSVRADDISGIKRYERVMTQLILKGADIDIICEETKNTMLHYSVKMGSVLVTHMLIERGARIKTQNVYGETTLHIAAGLNNNIDILHNLILHDGKESINHPDEVGYTPLHKAAFSGNKECLSLLINNGGNLTAETNTGLSVLDVIFSYVSCPVDFLISILDSKITVTDDPNHYNQFQISLNFSILKSKNPKDKPFLMYLLKENEIILHPLVQAFTLLKWKKIRPILSVLVIVNIYFAVSISLFFYNLVHDLQFDDFLSKTLGFSSITWKIFWIYSTLASGLIILVFSVFELLSLGPSCYKRFKSWLNLLSSLLSMVLILIAINLDDSHLPLIDCICYIGSVIVLYTWAQIMFLFERFPASGIYGLMFWAVLADILKVLTSCICLIIGFVFCFCIQYPNHNLFHNPFYSFLKTTIMMAGEFEYSDLFELGFFRTDLYATTVILILFVFLSSIVLMNLMVGVAVSELQDLQKRSHIKFLRKEIEFITHTERFITRSLRRTFIYKILIDKYKVPSKLLILMNDSDNLVKLPDTLLKTIFNIAKKNKNKQKTSYKRTKLGRGKKSDLKCMLKYVIDKLKEFDPRLSDDEIPGTEFDYETYLQLRRQSQLKRETTIAVETEKTSHEAENRIKSNNHLNAEFWPRSVSF